MKALFDIRRLGVSFSMSVLWFIKALRLFLYPGDYGFYREIQPQQIEFLAVLLNILILTFVFYLFLTAASAVSQKWVKIGFQFLFLFLVFSSFGALSTEISLWLFPSFLHFTNLWLPSILITICLVAAINQQNKIAALEANLSKLVLFFLPFTLFLFIQVAAIWITGGKQPLTPHSIEKSSSQKTENPDKSKIIWIIFDELDYGTLLNGRPDHKKIPEFENLMSQALVADQAFSPDFDTRDAIAALLGGKPIKSTIPISPNDMLINPIDGSEPFKFSEGENIFTDLAKSNGESAIVGWYLPYPRIFTKDPSFVYWKPLTFIKCPDLVNCSIYLFYTSLPNIPAIVRIFPSLSLLNVYQNQLSKEQIERHEYLQGQAQKLLMKPEIDLSLFHFSIPHEPYFGVDRIIKPDYTYFDSLEACDKTLKDIREVLEKSAQWSEATIIVTSDHWWREKTIENYPHKTVPEAEDIVRDRRIPFIVKLPGQKQNVHYSKPFNTVITRYLINDLFQGKIKTSEDLINKLDQLQTDQPDIFNFRADDKTN